MVKVALAECHGRIAGPTGAAAKLGIPRQTLESTRQAFNPILQFASNCRASRKLEEFERFLADIAYLLPGLFAVTFDEILH
jgi:hypothetical protein